MAWFESKKFEFDLSDCREVTPEMFAGAVVRRSVRNRAKVTVTIERDVLEWFQAQGDRADLQMALALKIYAEANKAYAMLKLCWGLLLSRRSRLIQS
jgi:uncharacterized protein (DUF4415 family)